MATRLVKGPELSPRLGRSTTALLLVFAVQSPVTGPGKSKGNGFIYHEGHEEHEEGRGFGMARASRGGKADVSWSALAPRQDRGEGIQQTHPSKPSWSSCSSWWIALSPGRARARALITGKTGKSRGYMVGGGLGRDLWWADTGNTHPSKTSWSSCSSWWIVLSPGQARARALFTTKTAKTRRGEMLWGSTHSSKPSWPSCSSRW